MTKNIFVETLDIYPQKAQIDTLTIQKRSWLKVFITNAEIFWLFSTRARVKKPQEV
jgi:hypothetical protein